MDGKANTIPRTNTRRPRLIGMTANTPLGAGTQWSIASRLIRWQASGTSGEPSAEQTTRNAKASRGPVVLASAISGGGSWRAALDIARRVGAGQVADDEQRKSSSTFARMARNVPEECEMF
jgi:hypothetical protein